MEALLKDAKTNNMTLLLHSCCAPCSSYVIDYLSDYFNIIVYFYNPNIQPKEEYYARLDEQKRLIKEMGLKNISLIEEDYSPKDFTEISTGLEKEKEGGKRCQRCYKMRLEKAAAKAAELGADYFTTTLSVSPYKNAQLLEEIAVILADKYSVKRLPSDFKKADGYKKSIQLSNKYNLYRQDYCGCYFSKTERDNKQNRKENIHE